MKFSATIALALAPLALARSARRSVRARDQADEDLIFQIEELQQGGDQRHGHGINQGGGQEIIVIWANPGNNAATTTINQAVTVVQTVTVAATAQATAIAGADGMATTIAPGQTATMAMEGAKHTVTVGGPGGLTYQPSSLSGIPVGDTVIFEFLSQNHTITQSGFNTPCVAMAGGMDSGFQPNPNNTVSPPPQIAMQVMVETPLWFYCRQKGHCGKGMVFSINPTAAKTQAMFMQMAIAQNGTDASGSTPPPPVASDASGSSMQGSTPPVSGSAVAGQGTVGSDGACTCMAVCSAGGFPNSNVQGVGSFGGMGGSLPIAMAMRR